MSKLTPEQRKVLEELQSDGMIELIDLLDEYEEATKDEDRSDIHIKISADSVIKIIKALKGN